MINQKMLAVLKELVKNSAALDHHPDVCSRTGECDDAACSGEGCSYCFDSCPDCECGVAITQEIVERAIQVIQDASQSS